MAKTTPIDWETDEDLVVQKQMPIRVFTNTAGNIVICQESDDQNEMDPLIVIRPENVEAVAKALLGEVDPE